MKILTITSPHLGYWATLKYLEGLRFPLSKAYSVYQQTSRLEFESCYIYMGLVYIFISVWYKTTQLKKITYVNVNRVKRAYCDYVYMLVCPILCVLLVLDLDKIDEYNFKYLNSEVRLIFKFFKFFFFFFASHSWISQSQNEIHH